MSPLQAHAQRHRYSKLWEIRETLAKPFSRDVLLAKIREVLDRG